MIVIAIRQSLIFESHIDLNKLRIINGILITSMKCLKKSEKSKKPNPMLDVPKLSKLKKSKKSVLKDSIKQLDKMRGSVEKILKLKQE